MVERARYRQTPAGRLHVGSYLEISYTTGMSDSQFFEPRSGVTIAYNKTDGSDPDKPGVVFLHGYRCES